MTQAPISIPESYAYCRRLVRQAGSNFGPCFWVLGPEKRRAMEALYAFMRHSDDLADNRLPVARRRETLDQWRYGLEVAMGLRSAAGRVRPAENGEAILPALADTVRRFSIPPEHLRAVLDGVTMDLDRAAYETFDDLKTYCRRVASAVGLACIHVWGFSDSRAVEPVDRCGIAFQLTNILRDLKEDAAAGRVYLPQEDLRACGYSTECLRAGVADARFGQLVAIEIERARQLYREGAPLFDYLEPDGRRIFGLMWSLYARLLEQIARSPAAVLAQRVRLSRWEKLALGLHWAFWPVRRLAICLDGETG